MNAQRQPALEDTIESGLRAMGITVEPPQLRQLGSFLRLLDKWNRSINLTAVRDPLQMVPRHLLDSLAALPWVRGPRLLDVGTGAGLPGLPVAIVRPQLQVVLLDSRSRRIQFLTQAVARLGLGNVETVHGRVQQYRPTEKFDTLTARAFASLSELLSATSHLCRPGGRILALKGRRPYAELQDLEQSHGVVAAVHRVDIPGLAAQRHIVVIEPPPGARSPKSSGIWER